MDNSRFIGKFKRVNFNGCKSWHTDVTQPWHGTDSEQTFEYNKKNHPNNPDFLRYNSKSISYKFNNLGFRSDFDYQKEDAGNVFIGCSMTEGVGLKWDETYHEHLSQTLEGKRINLSVGGTGIDSWRSRHHAGRKRPAGQMRSIWGLGRGRRCCKTCILRGVRSPAPWSGICRNCN